MTASWSSLIAGSTPAPAVVDAGIRLIVGMTLRAMSLIPPLLRAIASPHVLAASDCFQMVRPNAVTVSTAPVSDMIPNEPFRWSTSEEVMSTYTHAIGVEPAVAIMQFAQPEGTAISTARINLSPESSSIAGWARLVGHLEPILSGVTRRDADTLPPHSFYSIIPVAGAAA